VKPVNTAQVNAFVAVVGDYTLFLAESLQKLGGVWKRRSLFLRQCEFIGVTSVGIILVAAIFMGGVLGYQLYAAFHIFGADALLGGTVGVTVFRELGPVIAAIMVTGRAGAAMAAQLASMRITEQVDALEVMAVDPLEYLVMPRILAGVLMMPILGLIFSIMATISGAWVACGILGHDAATYWEQFAGFTDKTDLIHCVTKSCVFGFVFSSIGCFCGFRAQGGARAVGFATRTTVVASCLTILLSDYILTSLLPFGFWRLSVT
jgi:phospholipid/cholesterol/gamma-HCH transport system permease protein